MEAVQTVDTLESDKEKKEWDRMNEIAMRVAENAIFSRYPNRCYTRNFYFKWDLEALREKAVIVAMDYNNKTALSSIQNYNSGNGRIRVEFGDGYLTVRSQFDGYKSGEVSNTEKGSYLVKVSPYCDQFVQHLWLMRHGSKNFLLEASEDACGSIGSIDTYCVDDDTTLDNLFSSGMKMAYVPVKKINDYCGISDQEFQPVIPVKSMKHPSGALQE